MTPTKDHSLSIIEAQDQLPNLPDQFEKDIANQKVPVVKVMQDNKPVLAILPWDLYESIMETLEVLSDDKQMALLRQGLIEAVAERGIPRQTAKEELNQR